jgi:hypothetical protein
VGLNACVMYTTPTHFNTNKAVALNSSIIPRTDECQYIFTPHSICSYYVGHVNIVEAFDDR